MNLPWRRVRQDPSWKVKTGLTTSAQQRPSFRSGLMCWEVYPILLIAALARLYMIETTEFDADQATIFHMAHNAVSHGVLVATSNFASIGIANPPGIIYFLMLPAAFSDNPLWGAVFTAILATVGVGLTYVLCYRYFDRRVAALSSFFFATASLPIFYSRFMWQQNLLLFFVPLFMLILLWGAVEHRRGWLAPAVFLLGLLCQLHGSGILLAAPLLLALLLAPATVRWRDLFYAAALLLLSYAPYILWEFLSHFRDWPILLNTSGRTTVFDGEAFYWYQLFLSPYNALGLSTKSWLAPFLPLLIGIQWLSTILVIGGALMAGWFVVRGSSQPVVQMDATKQEKKWWKYWRALLLWWQELSCSSYRSSLSLLLIWQLVPLLLLLRHSIRLYPHYFIMFMPGPFILMSLLICDGGRWLGRLGNVFWQRIVVQGIRGVLVVLAVVILAVQLLGSSVAVYDLSHGVFVDKNLSNIYYNDLQSLQQAFSETDHLAQERHIRQIYIDADQSFFDASFYLMKQMHTPTSVFSDTCAVLPDVSAGPVLLLVGPHNALTEELLPRFATTTLVASSVRLGGPPFHIYLISAVSQPATVDETLSSDLQLTGNQQFSFQRKPYVLTRWRFMQLQPSRQNDSLYAYEMLPQGEATKHLVKSKRTIKPVNAMKCLFTSARGGDQILIPFRYTQSQQLPLQIKIQSYSIVQEYLKLQVLPSWSLVFETCQLLLHDRRFLVSQSGSTVITITANVTHNLMLPATLSSDSG